MVAAACARRVLRGAALLKVGPQVRIRFPPATSQLRTRLSRSSSWRTTSVNNAEPPASEDLPKAWKPYIETCIAAFGPQRSMFESNFPVDKGTCS